LSGNLSLYLRLLDILVRDNEQLVTALPDFTTADARRALASRAHKLRGGLGLLGATSIEQLATEAEVLLASESLETRTSLVVQELLSQLHALILRIKDLKSAKSNTSATAILKGDQVDSAELSELEQLLRSHDLAALDRFQTLTPRLQSHIPDTSFGRLRAALEELRFREAADLVSTLRRSA